MLRLLKDGVILGVYYLNQTHVHLRTLLCFESAGVVAHSRQAGQKEI